MQPIPPAVKALLKSRSMVGPDAPNAQVLFLDVSGAVDWSRYSGFFRPAEQAYIKGAVPDQTVFEVSVARKANGRLIWVSCYSETGDDDPAIPVYEGEAADVETLLSANDSVAGWAPSGIVLNRYGRCAAFNVGAGLYMATYELGDTISAPARGRIWRSPSGNGGDWTLHGTIYSLQLTVSSIDANRMRKATAGVPEVLPGGRWVIGGPRFAQTSILRVVYYSVWTSDDAGVTWTLRHTFTVGVTGYEYLRAFNRRTVRDAVGRLWTVVDFDSIAGVTGFNIYVSEDNGVTWTLKRQRTFGNNPAIAWHSPSLVPHHGGLGFYMFWCGNLGDRLTLTYWPDPYHLDEDQTVGSWAHGHSWHYRPLGVLFSDDSRMVIAVGNLVVGYPVAGAPLAMRSVRINRDQAALAQRALLSRANVNPANPADPGYFSPDRGVDDPQRLNEWRGVMMPGKRVQILLGYGAHRALAFTGMIDETVLDAHGPNYEVRLECRDRAWRLIDKTVSDGGTYKLSYSNRTIEYILRDLLVRAGIPSGDITTQATGITVAKKEFERETYADAVEWCLKVSGFELVFDEAGRISFHYPTDRQPEATDEALILHGTDWTVLANPWIVAQSERVRSAPGGGGTLYSRTADYEIDLGDPARIRRRSGGLIPNGGTVYASYVHAAYSFAEGEDLFRLPYRISRRNAYGKIVVIGQTATAEWFPPEGEPIIATFTWAGATDYGIPPDKVLFCELRELDTAAKCQAAADQLGNDMIRKVREAEFVAVGNPWIQIGDCVRIRESSSTISEIYRVTNLEHELDDQGFLTRFTAYHYGYTPLA